MIGLNGENLTERSFKLPSGGTSVKWKLFFGKSHDGRRGIIQTELS